MDLHSNPPRSCPAESTEPVCTAAARPERQLSGDKLPAAKCCVAHRPNEVEGDRRLGTHYSGRRWILA